MPTAKYVDRPKSAPLAPAFAGNTHFSQTTTERSPRLGVLGDPHDGSFTLVVGHNCLCPALKFRKFYNRL
jgi:hypothetical protein